MQNGSLNNSNRPASLEDCSKTAKDELPCRQADNVPPHGNLPSPRRQRRRHGHLPHPHLRCCKYSNFFRSAVIWSWVRSTGDVVNLPNYEPDTFELYLHWCSTNTLPVSEESEEKPEYCDLLLLAKAYALGAYLADTFFQDAVADALMHRLYAKREVWGRCKGCRWEFVAYLYDKTVSSSPIRHLLVALLARDYERWLSEVGAAGLPKEFMSDLLAYVAGVTAHRPMQEYWGKCTFHLHEAEQECYRRHFMVD